MADLKTTVINGIIANESFNEGRQSLSELTISEQNKKHQVWLLIWFYSVIPRNLRLQAKTIFFYYTKERSNFKIKHNGRNVLTNDELFKPWNLQKKFKNACLYSINEYLTSSTCLPFKRIWTKNQSNLRKILRDKKKVRKFNEKVMPVACIWVYDLYTN